MMRRQSRLVQRALSLGKSAPIPRVEASQGAIRESRIALTPSLRPRRRELTVTQLRQPGLSPTANPLSSQAMHRDHHNWYSHRLSRDMGVNVYGHYGMPILAFPTSMGDEHEQEGQGMVRARPLHRRRTNPILFHQRRAERFVQQQRSAPVPPELDAGSIARGLATTWWFEYGRTAGYGFRTVETSVSGSADLRVSRSSHRALAGRSLALSPRRPQRSRDERRLRRLVRDAAAPAGPAGPARTLHDRRNPGGRRPARDTRT